eukprot:37-Pyramimonas_sp.AAC.1
MECWWLQGRGHQTVFVHVPQVGASMEHIRSIVREWRRQKFTPQGTCSYEELQYTEWRKQTETGVLIRQGKNLQGSAPRLLWTRLFRWP